MYKKTLISAGTFLGTSAIVIGMGITAFFVTEKFDYEKNNSIEHVYHKNAEANIQFNDASGINKNLSNLIVNKVKNISIDSLPYGPELNLLKEINFLWDKNSRDTAFFQHNDNSIHINLAIIEKLYKLNFHKNSYLNYEINNISLIIFQYVFHEYLHFMAKIYIRKQDDSIYYGKNPRKVQKWHKEFINSFKQILGYDKNSQLITQKFLTQNMQSIANIYNTKQLFDLSNSQALPYYDLPNNKIGFFHPLTQRQNILPLKKESLEYLYSIDELFVRKYQLLLSPFQPTIKKTYTRNGITPRGHFYNAKGFLIEMQILEDVHLYKENLKNDNLVFMQDYVFAKNKVRQTRLLQLLNKFTRAINLTPISVLFKKDNDVSFGGFLPSSKFNYIGYKDQGILQIIPIFKYKYNVKLKKSLIDAQPIIPKIKWVYYVKDKIPLNIIQNKELYFVENQKSIKGQKMVIKNDWITTNSREWNYPKKPFVSVHGDATKLFIS